MNDNVYLKKIEEFKTFTKVNDDDLARNYLIKNDWNVEHSVGNYLDDVSSSSPAQRNKVNSVNFHNFPNTSSNNQQSSGVFGLIKNVMDFGSSFFGHNERTFTNIYSNNNYQSPIFQPTERRNKDVSQKIKRLFDFVTSKEPNFNNFLNKLRQRPGILIAFNENSLERLSQLVTDIKNEEYLIDMMSNSYYLNLIDSNSLEYKELSKNFSIHILPAIIYINKNQFNTINNENVLLIDENFTIDTFRETIFNQINDPRNTPSTQTSNPASQTTQTNNINNINNDIYHDEYPHTDSDLIHIQNQQLRELERQAEEQHKKELNERKEKEKRELEQKMKIEEEQLNKHILKSQLPPEPEHNDPDAFLVAFRSPHNDLRKERRFKKTDTIQVLYDFVESHADEFEVKNYVLFRPFLGNLDNRNKTLQEENLSNAVLQIKEL